MVYHGEQFTTSNNLTDSGQNHARAGGKFNSMNSHKFNDPVRNGGGQGISNNFGYNYDGPLRPTSQPNNFFQDKFKQNRPNLGELEKNSRGKFNIVVVKNAMSAINNKPNKKVKQYAKNLQSTLCVENLTVKYANTGDLEELQYGLDKNPRRRINRSQESQVNLTRLLMLEIKRLTM
jgi:hypothetical protein